LKTASFLAVLCALSVGQARAAQQFLIISDIHFNPLADPALAAQLMAAAPSQWEGIFSADARSPAPKYGDDSSWALLSTLVTGMQSIQPRPRVIILTGDVLPHKFQDKFSAITHQSDTAAFRSFAQKTFTFIGLELQKASAGVPLIYTLGNNDEECGDYALQPNGPFLEDTQETAQTLAQVNAGVMAQWVSLGSYVAANPLAPHHRIIALNSNFWSSRYHDSCGPDADPGQAEMNWLADQLKDAAARGDKVWLAYHIPPGIDGHSSSRAGKTVPFWKATYAEAFNKLLDQYRKTIEMNLAGHTHLDDIRLVKSEHAETLVIINPGVSPNVGQNPAYRLVTVDAKARPIDITTYYLPKLDALKWEQEYSLRSAYGLKKVDAASYQKIYQSIVGSDQWKRYYSVSRPAAVSNDKSYQRSLYCATGNSAPEAFQKCVDQSSSLP